jgi:LacI family transcriptional regulator
LQVAYFSRETSIYNQNAVMEFARCAREFGPWHTLIATLGEVGPEDILAGRVNGAIMGHWDDQPTISALRRAMIPTVVTSHLQDHIPFMQVVPDDYTMGVLAAKHLASKGFREFAYYSMSGRTTFSWERLRRDGFSETLKNLNYPIHICDNALPVHDNALPDWWRFQNNRQQKDLRRWLKTLPKPVGLFACMDRLAYDVVRIAREEEIIVPEDLAVCGVDNNPWVCMLSSPQLTSIPHNITLTIRKAAETLHAVMRGQMPPKEPILIPPLPVVQRESTEVMAFQDADLADAFRFIREHAGEPISVGDVVAKVLVSRRRLEMRFKNLIGTTLQNEIWRAHVDCARKLLTDSHQKMWKIAEESGFRSETVFNVVFKRTTGMTPSEYRRDNGKQAS